MTYLVLSVINRLEWTRERVVESRWLWRQWQLSYQ